MTTTIQQDELSTELQELYLKGKQWISELDFQQDEIKFLKMLFEINSPLLVNKNEFDEIADIMVETAKIESGHLRLVKVISDFMQFVSALANVVDPGIDNRLIIWNTQLENDVKMNSDEFREFKKRVFKLAID